MNFCSPSLDRYPLRSRGSQSRHFTGGVHSAIDVVKCILAGASVTMMTAVLLQRGIHHAFSVLTDLHCWLEEHEYDSVRQMCGSMSRRSVPDPTAFERGNYMRVLSSYTFRSGHLNH